MFKFDLITHHMLEHGEPAACATGGAEDTLEEAIEAAIDEMENVPQYDGRGAKVVSISDDNGNEHNFYWPGYWGNESV